MAHCNVDERDYAVKAISKTYLYKQKNGIVFIIYSLLNY